MSSSGKSRGNHEIRFFRLIKIYHLGRGRARPTLAKEFDAPGGLQDNTESETASCVSEQSDIAQCSSEVIPSDEV